MDAFVSSFFAPDGATTTSKNKGDGITTSPDLPPQDSSSSQCPSLADLSSSSFSSSSSSSSLSFSNTVDGAISDSNSNTSSDFNGDYSLSVLLPKRKMFGCASSSGDDDNHPHDLYPIDELLDHDDNPTDEDGNHDHDDDGGGEGIREGYDEKEETTPGRVFLETKSEHKDILTVSVVQHEKGVNICSVVNQIYSNSRSDTNQNDLSSTVYSNNNEPKNDEEPNVLPRVGEEPTCRTDDVTPKSSRVKKSKKKNAKKGKKNRRASIDGSVDGDQSTLAPTSDAKGKTVQTRRVKKKKPKAAGTISSSPPPPPSILVSAESKQSIRKSSSSNRRSSNSVSFYPRVRIHRVPKRCHLSEELMDAIWYSVHDFRSFRQDCYDTMYRMMKLDEVDPMDVEDCVKDETSMDEIIERNDDYETYGGGGRLSPSSSLPSIFFDEEGNDYCRRGLELRVDGLQDGRQRRKKKVRDIVTAQQTFEDVTGMETDPIFLASLLRPHSKACVELAIKAAECDAEEACLIHFEEMNDQEKQKL
mmetsp:Transcript_40907/g.97948  ORF Transcript_40907/g.97948 Transcript_40907/m.97948 type:complete len:530 (-) Transcript_40907:132-1721(-)